MLRNILLINTRKFFGQARQRDNLYTDVNVVMVAGKVQRLHQLVKHDVIIKQMINQFHNVPAVSKSFVRATLISSKVFKLLLRKSYLNLQKP